MRSIKSKLKRPIPLQLSFSHNQLRYLRQWADNAGLSKAEYARRKIMDMPIADIRKIEGNSHSIPINLDELRNVRFQLRFSQKEYQHCKQQAKRAGMWLALYGWKKIMNISVEKQEPLHAA